MDRDERVVEALVVLDVISTFEHDDGDSLLDSMRRRAPAIERVLVRARRQGIAVIYANDAGGTWDGDAPAHVERALAGKGGNIVRQIAPAAGDRFLFKAAYSAFDDTPLARLLDELGATRVVLAGAATEMCVAQTAIDAREKHLPVTVLRDACASVHRRNERIALDYLEHVTGSIILTVNEWLETAPRGFATSAAGKRAKHE